MERASARCARYRRQAIEIDGPRRFYQAIPKRFGQAAKISVAKV
jgi:hypothetical protein